MRRLNLLIVVVVMGVIHVAAEAASSRGNAKAGETIYIGACQICHGPTGQGDPAMAAYYQKPMPNFSAKDTQNKTDVELRRIIVHGHGTDMWSYRGAFEENQLDDLIAYIRSLKR